jgi:mRNA-degrading endonuclease RelE of RelBE toxin-antitoxin system
MSKSKKIAKPVAPKNLPATSKRSCTVELSDDLLESLRKRGRPESKIIGDAINEAAESWGFPHKHAGIGLRHLVKNYYECRSGLKTRLLFRATPGTLYFFLEANHNQVRVFIKDI